ncbi:MAG: hypothetical protein H6741_29395 [Alphaproteobacteria bacterium]|nr:hypothetical protein [Alphaproteobacteria bacterium]MCB9796836.1 hypothetical protein [Alphaproteobacteria bacterium]
MRRLPLLALLALGCRTKDVPDTALNGGPGFDSDAQSEDSGGTPDVELPGERLCPSSAFSEDPETPLLWATRGSELFFLKAGGELVSAHVFGEDLSPPEDATLNIQVSVSGAGLGAVGAWTSIEQPEGGWSELVLFDRSGEALAVSSEGDSTSTWLRVGEDGLTYARGYVNNDSRQGLRSGILMSSDGSIEELDGYVPRSFRNSEGWLVACSTADDHCAWIKPGEDPRYVRSVSSSELIQVPGWLATMESVDGAPTLRWASPDEENTLDLSESFPNVPFEELRVLHTKPEGWVLIGRQPSNEEPPRLNTLLLVNVHTGEAETGSVDLPDGLWRFWDNRCPSPLVQVSSAGDLLLLLRGEASGGVYHQPLDGSALTLLGEAITDIYGIWPVENAGTVQILASSGQSSFCPLTSWAEPEEGDAPLEGDTLQVLLDVGVGPAVQLAPNRGTAGQWPLRPAMFTSDGLCGLWDDPELSTPGTVLIDVTEGSRVELDTDYTGWGWLW